MFYCRLLGGGERALNVFSQRLPIIRQGKPIHCWPKNLGKKGLSSLFKQWGSLWGWNLYPVSVVLKGVNQWLPLTWDGTIDNMLVYFEHKPVLVFSWIDQGFAKNKCLVKKTQHTKSIDNEIWTNDHSGSGQMCCVLHYCWC